MGGETVGKERGPAGQPGEQLGEAGTWQQGDRTWPKGDSTAGATGEARTVPAAATVFLTEAPGERSRGLGHPNSAGFGSDP